MNIIETENITKQFRTTKALDAISIKVQEGEIYGFIGLNGAGKTTLIRILLGMIAQTNGAVKIFGDTLNKKFNHWNNIGYLVETPYGYPNLSVLENIKVYYLLRQLKNKSLIDEVIEKLNLTNYAHIKAKYLSLGNQQRLGLAKALLHKPKLLILDEPINGLDPEGIVEVRELLKELCAAGSTVFLSSHILGEISKLAGRIAIIHKGKLLKELTVDELDGKLIKRIVADTTNNQQAVSHLLASQYQAVLNTNNLIEITGDEAIKKPERISTLLVEKGVPVKQLYLITEDLEMYFLRTIEDKSNE
ncbi:MAG: ABC transporter ATP-binding protein [Spirochaetales bacterium]|jgi:ABC-2 type transport system ATP-binding protein|nr:ABC transporter ATP-binding protein [Spirochaetales bacterium]